MKLSNNAELLLNCLNNFSYDKQQPVECSYSYIKELTDGLTVMQIDAAYDELIEAKELIDHSIGETSITYSRNDKA